MGAENGLKHAEAVTWFDIARAGENAARDLDKLNAAANRIPAMPDIRKHFDDEGAEVQGGTPEQFAAFTKKEASASEHSSGRGL